MEYVISKSFSQFQHEQQLPELESRLKAAEAGGCHKRGCSCCPPPPFGSAFRLCCFWKHLAPLLRTPTT